MPNQTSDFRLYTHSWRSRHCAAVADEVVGGEVARTSPICRVFEAKILWNRARMILSASMHTPPRWRASCATSWTQDLMSRAMWPTSPESRCDATRWWSWTGPTRGNGCVLLVVLVFFYDHSTTLIVLILSCGSHTSCALVLYVAFGVSSCLEHHVARSSRGTRGSVCPACHTSVAFPDSTAADTMLPRLIILVATPTSPLVRW